jgi:cell division protein FtsB
MVTRQRRRSFFALLWLPLVTIAVLGYFGYHAFNGSYGIWELLRLEGESARLEIVLSELQREQAAMDRRAASLRPASLDSDVVDIEARSSLNLMRPDEIVISFGAVQQTRR